MGNRAENILNSIQENCSDDVFKKAKGIISETQKASPAKQGKVIKECLVMLAAEEVDIKSVLRGCNCLSNTTIKKQRNIILNPQEI